MSQLIRPLIVVALYALLLPVVGPALDHHYVEWQHGHGHAYLGSRGEGGPAVHVHVYDFEGSHLHTGASSSPDTSQLPEGLAYFSNYDGAGAGPIYSPTGPATESPLCSHDGDRPLLAAFESAFPLPLGAFIVPPTKPPALMLL